MVPCLSCNGYGYIVIAKMEYGQIKSQTSKGCPDCHATGRVTELEDAMLKDKAKKLRARMLETVENWMRRN